MRTCITIILCFVALTLAGCAGGSSDSSSAPTPPPQTPNPLNGVVTFANGAAFSITANYGILPNQMPIDTSCNFFINGSYALTGFGNQTGSTIDFSHTGSNELIGGYVHNIRLVLDYTSGAHEVRQLCVSTDGGVYLMSLSGSGADDFHITSLNASPRPLIPGTLVAGSTYNGGFSGHSLMTIVSTDDTAPSGELHCIHITEEIGGVVTDWWLQRNVGFVATTRTSVNGYSRGLRSIIGSGFARMVFGAG